MLSSMATFYCTASLSWVGGRNLTGVLSKTDVLMPPNLDDHVQLQQTARPRAQRTGPAVALNRATLASGQTGEPQRGPKRG